MSNVARNEFVKLTKYVNSIGGKVESKTDTPFALNVVFPYHDVVVDDEEEKRGQAPVRSTAITHY